MLHPVELDKDKLLLSLKQDQRFSSNTMLKFSATDFLFDARAVRTRKIERMFLDIEYGIQSFFIITFNK